MEMTFRFQCIYDVEFKPKRFYDGVKQNVGRNDKISPTNYKQKPNEIVTLITLDLLENFYLGVKSRILVLTSFLPV